jgi:predicted ATPase
LAHALHNIAMNVQPVGDRQAILAAAERAFGVAEKFGIRTYGASSLVLTAWASAVGASVAGAAHVVDKEIDSATTAGPVPQYYLGLAADILLAAGRAADGLIFLDRALAGVDEPGVGFYLPEIYRLRGQCLLALSRDNKDAARSAFTAARDIAKRQGAVIFERRAETSLAEIAS